MRHSVPATFLIVLLAAGCGKVGDPRPPAIRIPAQIVDLKASQDHYDVTLTWTNPQKNVDGSTATDLANVRIFINGSVVETVPVTAAGKLQSSFLSVRAALGTTPIYSVEVETRRGKMSTRSNEARIEVFDVPGAVVNLRGGMDQHCIRLDWDRPNQNPTFADVYIVRRVDGADLPGPVSDTHFEDTAIDVGKTYSYIVTAVRKNGSVQIPGPPSSPFVILALDKTAPAVPTGLQSPVVSGSGAILRWDTNNEADLAGYWIYRSDNSDTGFVKLNVEILTISSFRDENYRPGSYYKVSAQDESGNESAKSLPVRAP